AGAVDGWRQEGERRERRAVGAGPVSEHTAEWTLDTPQKQGYVGSRRAESSDDEPVSGPAPRSRPRRAQPRRPQVTWSGLAGANSPGGEGDGWEPGSTGPRSRWSGSSDSWSRPASDPWSRSADPGPAEQSAVDPWDASGVHAWDRAVVAEQRDGTGRWDRTEHTGEWDRITDTGEWDRTVPPAREGWASAEQAEAFWSGTRLAGDDPRWTETPTSAAHSPAVPYPAPRPLEDDLLDPDPGGPIRPLVYTAACYLVPALLVVVGLLFLDGQAPAGCVTDITGGGCDSPRAHALASLIAGAPRFGLALVSSLVVAVVLRRVGTTWRSATVALAAAVVGGGLSTVMISAVTGQPIG
ncbi:hypothetical protein ONA70_35975, partial [Micromonospora yasonensis]|nr:hypothetical protein [Micromonospora yasonensis]